MIGWLVDRWWAWKNRDELRQLDEQAAYLRAEGERMDRHMAEAFGPDWRTLSNNRLAEIMAGRFRIE